MAERAEASRVAADIRPPDYRKAVQTMRGSIVPKKDKIGSINGEIADVWAKIEGFKVNKMAGKFFLKLDALEPEERREVYRSLNGLADAAGWPEHAEADLADRAEDKVVSLRVGGDSGGEGGGGAAGGGGDDDGGAGGSGAGGDDEDGDGDQEARGSKLTDALEGARRHLGGAGARAGKAADPGPLTKH